MGVERVDYYSDEEYQQALQMETLQEQEFADRQAEEEYLNSVCPQCEKLMYECRCKREQVIVEPDEDDLPF